MITRNFLALSAVLATTAVSPLALAQSGAAGGSDNASGARSGSASANAAGGGQTMIGNMSEAQFTAANQQGLAAIQSVQANNAQLNEKDQELMMELANAGMMQLEASRIAAQKATAPDIKMIAQAEVQEQTALSNKLKEIAAAKNVSLPSAPNEKAQKMVAKLNQANGAELDSMYIKQGGVKGHEQLLEILNDIRSDAQDPALKALAEAARPAVMSHLQISQAEAKEMS